MEEQYIVLLDIGSSILKALVTSQDGTILRSYKQASLGVQNGIVVDKVACRTSLEKIFALIHLDLDIPEKFSLFRRKKISKCYILFSGSHLYGTHTSGLTVLRPNDFVTEYDISQVLEAASTVIMTEDKELVQLVLNNFIADNINEVSNPLGISCLRLELKGYAITANKLAIANLRQNIIECRQQIDRLYPSGMGASLACSQDELKQGLLSINIGSDNTELCIYHEEYLKYYSCFNFGGNVFTNTIAQAFRTSIERAEFIKCQIGIAKPSWGSPKTEVSVTSIGQTTPKAIQSYVVGEALEEPTKILCGKIVDKLREIDITDIREFAAVKISGGGAALPNLAMAMQEELRTVVTHTEARELRDLPLSEKSEGKLSDGKLGDEPSNLLAFAPLCGIVKLLNPGYEELLRIWEHQNPLKSRVRRAVSWLNKHF